MPANKTPSDGQRPAAQRTAAQRAAAAERVAARANGTSTPPAGASVATPVKATLAKSTPPNPTLAKSTPPNPTPPNSTPPNSTPPRTGSATAVTPKAAATTAPTPPVAKAPATQPATSTAAEIKAAVAKTAATKAATTPAAAKAATTKPAVTKTTATKTTGPKTTGAKTTGAKTTGAKTTGAKTGAGRPSGNRAAAARASRSAAATGPSKKRSKSLVVKRRTPWGLIITCVLVVVFAAAVIGYAVSRPKKISADDAPYVRNEIAAAKAIDGMLFKKHIQHTHITTLQKYDTSPPTGGNHSQIWADCTGTVYPKQIANENAVHPLEHGAVWITYRPGLAAASVATLAKLVTGVNYMFMTPYAGLKTPISLQAWNYQLFVNSPTDSRIKAFIKALRDNPGTQPENASCSQPSFKKNPSTPGHPIWQ